MTALEFLEDLVQADVTRSQQHEDVVEKVGSLGHNPGLVIADTRQGQLHTFLADYQALLGRVAEQPLVRSLDPKRCDPAIKELVRLLREEAKVL